MSIATELRTRRDRQFKSPITVLLRSSFLKRASKGSAVIKNLPANAGDTGDLGLGPGSGRSPGVENGNLLHFSCLENSMDRVAWWASLRGRKEPGRD